MDDAVAAPAERLQLRTRGLQAAGVLVFLAIALWAARSLDWAALGRALWNANWWLLAGAAVANLFALYFQSLRWRALLSPLAPVSRLVSFTALALGFAFSALLPARLGEVARLEHLSRRSTVPRGAVTGSIVLDHVVNGLTLAPMLLPLVVAGGLPTWVHRGVAVVLVVVTAIGVFSWFAATHERPNAKTGGWRRRLLELRAGFVATRSPKPFVIAVAWGLAAWAMEVLTAWLSMRAFDLPVSWPVALLLLVAINLALAAPSPPGNVGTFELGAAVALTALGVSREPAVAFALGYHALQLASVWAMAIVLWPLRNRT